jgi:nucleotide sugar dehydrogenase
MGRGKHFFPTNRPLVCVQGLGFVGVGMSVAVASALDKRGNPFFNVVGIDLDTPLGRFRIDSINSGKFPFRCTDEKMVDFFTRAIQRGNLKASSDETLYALADYIIVDIPLDITFNAEKNDYDIDLSPFRKAVRSFGERIKPECLVIIETTVPPGTCERTVLPELWDCFRQRGLDGKKILLAFSYERIMPGKDYLDSIINFWRVFSGVNEESCNRCESFLSKVINTRDFPLRKLKSLVSAETAKVLENSYRATNIALMEEWGRFAEALNVDLFEIIDAIRIRPTHSNIRQPGFGVGGYCLTKDPLFAGWSAKNFYGLKELDFPFCTQAIAKNMAMPLVTVNYAEKLLEGNLSRKKILLLGVSYRQDVADTRFSPSEVFVKEAQKRGAQVVCHDPLVSFWDELKIGVLNDIPSIADFDLAVFAVPHREYTLLDLARWARESRVRVIDANRVLTDKQRFEFVDAGGRLFSIGRGENI